MATRSPFGDRVAELSTHWRARGGGGFRSFDLPGRERLRGKGAGERRCGNMSGSNAARAANEITVCRRKRAARTGSSSRSTAAANGSTRHTRSRARNREWVGARRLAPPAPLANAREREEGTNRLHAPPLAPPSKGGEREWAPSKGGEREWAPSKGGGREWVPSRGAKIVQAFATGKEACAWSGMACWSASFCRCVVRSNWNRKFDRDFEFRKIYERSSTGRAPVSKTGGWGFDSLRSCCRLAAWRGQ
jgi:hypothetical protein